MWAYPEKWFWLGLVPLLSGGFIWAFKARRQALYQIIASPLASRLSASVDWPMRRTKTVLICAGALFMVLALIGPQWGFRWQEVKRRGVDIVIVLDVSKSMLAEDVKPSRLERAKLAIQDLLGQLKGDRIGLVAFAGTSFIQCPLTVDYGAFSLTLDELNVETIPRGGTALAEAIRSSAKAFEASSSDSRALILITDGEDHAGAALEAAKTVAKEGIKIFCIGIGTAEGELIPITDAAGNRTFLKDREGRTVKSRLDESTLQQIALAANGSYVRSTSTAFGLDRVYSERISKLAPKEEESSRKKQPYLRYQWPLAMALLLLGLEPWLSDRKRMASP